MSEDAPKAKGAPAWMATFGDMMSLLLCFFVLLLSFANMDIIKFRQMQGSLKDAFGTTKEGVGEQVARTTQVIEMLEEAPPPPPPVPAQTAEDQAIDRELHQVISGVIQTRGLGDEMEAVIGERGVTIRANGKLMFPAASDDLRGEARRVLQEIADLASLFPHMIAVEGHTDDQPIKTERYPSNWELSTARAVSGVRFLIDEGLIEPGRVSASGFAHTRPLQAGETPDARAKNRRLEFVFYRDKAAEAADAPIDLSDTP